MIVSCCICGLRPNLHSYPGQPELFRYECTCGQKYKFRSGSVSGAKRDWNRFIGEKSGWDMDLSCEWCGRPMIINENGSDRLAVWNDDDMNKAIESGWKREMAFGTWTCPDCTIQQEEE